MIYRFKYSFLILLLLQATFTIIVPPLSAAAAAENSTSSDTSYDVTTDLSIMPTSTDAQSPTFHTTLPPSHAGTEVDSSKKEPVEYYALFGILLLKRGNGSDVHRACTSYYPELSKMAHNASSAAYHPVLDVTEWSPCETQPPLDSIEGHVLLLNGTALAAANCSVLEAATAVQGYGALGSAFVQQTPPPAQTILNTSLWMVFVSNATYQDIVSADSALAEIAAFSPSEDFALNYSLVVIWLLAVVTVTMGSYWSGRTRHRLYQVSLVHAICAQSVVVRPSSSSPSPSRGDDQQHQQLEESEGEEGDEVDGQADSGHTRGATDAATGTHDITGTNGSTVPIYVVPEETSMDISPKVALLFVLLMCVMLLMLYFLYQYLVYVIIGLFCFASVGAVYCCLEPLVLRIPCGTCRTPYFNLWVIRGQLELRHLLLLVFALSLTLTWLVLRNESYAWVLQDTLGVAFCINMLRVVRLPSLKICTVLLGCLFIYDIFFVFITPLFTKDGTSIMVEVAQGSGASGGEQLPMVFKVPHFAYSEVVQVCELKRNYNLLGFGDVLVPGLLISFVYSYDLKSRVGACPLYFVVNVIAYALGLCITFVGLYLMRGAQPALLYLVPCALLPTVVLAAVRGDLAEMWQGDHAKKLREEDEKPEEVPSVVVDVHTGPAEGT